METLLQDLRNAFRMLRRNPGFTAVAILVLALGIGANSALFGVVNSLLLKPPPGLTGADRLVWVMGDPRFGEMTYPDYLDFRAGTDLFEGMAAYESTAMALGSGGDPISVEGQLVSGNYFEVLGANPPLGRGFLPESERPSGSHTVVVLSHRLWETRFNADPSVIGATVNLNGNPFTVVGVAAEGFSGTDFQSAVELWVPILAQPIAMPRQYDVLAKRDFPNFTVIGRLADGVTTDAAEAALRGIAIEINPLEPERVEPLAPVVENLRGWLPVSRLGSTIPIFTLAAIITGLVLLIACANVGNLLLARAVRRRREFGIRSALGAGRGRLIRQLLAESVLLAVLGAGVGLVMAFWGAELFKARFLDLVGNFDVSPDATTLLFSLSLAVVTGVVFGLAPAWRASKTDVTRVIQGDRTARLRRSHLQSILVIAQMALSLALLVTAGLFLRKFQEVATLNVGFDAEHVLEVSYDPSTLGMSPEAREVFSERLAGRVRGLPGVIEATTSSSPYSLHGVYAGPEEGSNSEPTVATGASPEFFRTLGISLVRGRGFTESENQLNAPPVAIVSESLAERLWPGQNPIGRRVYLDERSSEPMEVVGVAADARVAGLDETNPNIVYRPAVQHYLMPDARLMVRTRGNPLATADEVRGILRGLAPSLPISRVATLAESLQTQIGVFRNLSMVAAGFGALALALAAIGLYGVMAFTVAARTREIGIRMALGAHRPRVLGLFLRDGARLMLVGGGIGVLLALALGRLVASAIEGVPSSDPLSLVAVALVLTAVALVASYLPARRAARVDPMVALRSE